MYNTSESLPSGAEARNISFSVRKDIGNSTDSCVRSPATHCCTTFVAEGGGCLSKATYGRTMHARRCSLREYTWNPRGIYSWTPKLKTIVLRPGNRMTVDTFAMQSIQYSGNTVFPLRATHSKTDCQKTITKTMELFNLSHKTSRNGSWFISLSMQRELL